MKKVLSALLIMLMLIQTVSFAANKVYSEEETRLLVDRLNTLGIFNQFDEELFFGDNAGIKRSEAAVVISNMLGMKSDGSGASAEIKFFDVPQFSDYITAVNYVTGLGIMTGDSAGLFRPDETMEIAHVYKALVVALGYGWKAEAYGGYPAGYVKVAADLEIADVVSKGINETATRLDFLNMVNAALDAPICRMKSISGDVMDFEIDEDVTVLSEYHDIYFDEGIVENNKSMNISSTPEIEEDVVYIDGRKIYVNGVTNVYANFGYKVDYYYRHDEKADTNYLVAVTPSDENTEIKIARADFDGFADGKITYYNEDGKEKNIKVSSSVVVLYNSEVATNVSTAVNSFEGTLTVIDNNADNQVDVIIAKNYTYDKVKSVKAAENKIYANSKVFNLDSYETVDMVVAESGEPIELSAIETGSVIGYATSVDGTKLMVDVLGAGVAVKVKSLSQDTFTTDEGKEYSTELLSAEHKALIKPNAAISLVVIDGYYGVWVGLASEAAASIGYLINIATDTEFDKTFIVGARILDISGSIKALKAANKDKMILNGKSVNPAVLVSELARVKAEYQLGGDGEIAQLIEYKMDDEGNLSHIYTVDNEDENTSLYLKYGFNRNGLVKFYSNDPYGTITYQSEDFKYEGQAGGMVHHFNTNSYIATKTHPILLVPEENQETAGESWYGVKTGISTYKGESGFKMESFTSGKYEILPKVMIEYRASERTQTNVFNEGDIMLVESTYQTLNNDDGVDYVVSGVCEGKKVTYTVDGANLKANASDADMTVEEIDQKTTGAVGEEPGFTTGDIAMIELDVLGNIIRIEKIFDRETRSINPELQKTSETKHMDYAIMLHVYNKPADGYALEFFEEDLTLGIPGDDRKLLLNLAGAAAGKVNDKAVSFAFYDDAQEKVYVGSSLDIVDYRQDPRNYTRIFAIYSNSKTSFVFYNFENN